MSDSKSHEKDTPTLSMSSRITI